MKLFKKIQKTFGDAAGLYFDKKMLNHLKVQPGDEVVIELINDTLIIKKSIVPNNLINEVLKNVKI